MKCEACGHVQAPRPRKAAEQCDPATCWQWDHACWAKRMRRGRAPAAAAPIGPAIMAGRVLENARLAA